MKVSLIGLNEMHNMILPKQCIGNYWLGDEYDQENNKLVNIEGFNKYWKVKSNSSTKLVDASSISNTNDGLRLLPDYRLLDEIVLQEYQVYYLLLKSKPGVFVLLCEPDSEDNFIKLNVIKSLELKIGSVAGNDLLYSSSLISDNQAKITYENGHWLIENYDKKFGTFVNGIPITKNPTPIFNGDVIFCGGLRIVPLGTGVFVNNPNEKFVYNTSNLAVSKEEVKFDNLIAESDEEVEIYSEKDYFNRAPRIENIIEKEKIVIDSPPSNENKEGMPLALTLGTTISMGAMMSVSLIMTLDRLSSGQATLKQSIPSLVMASVMLLGMILFPILTRTYEKRQKVAREAKRQIEYKKYINEKANYIESVMNKQRKILFDNFVSGDECMQIIMNQSPRLWERKIDDRDFLKIRVGAGDVPLEADISYPQEHFSLEEDNLLDTVKEVTAKSNIIENAPITLSLTEKFITAISSNGDDELMQKYMRNIILQLITFQSYEDLKLVFLVKKDASNKWDFVKRLPHVWSNQRDIRFFADDFDDMKELSSYLEYDLQQRMDQGRSKSYDFKGYKPYFLIITDDYDDTRNLKIIEEVSALPTNVGYGILCITDNLMQVPDETSAFINLTGESGYLFENELSTSNQKQFMFDSSKTYYFDKISEKLMNMPIKINEKSSTSSLPTSYSFLDMFDVGKIEQLNILDRWSKNDSTISLAAPIGVDSNGNIISLDIHEKAHGPHGLIAGSTGSGKSEFIISYILSMAVNYHPHDVSFVLIDYKGGGLAGAFKKTDSQLPHVVGTITNIDTAGLQRSLASIQSELKRREVIFNEAREQTDEGTMDIYKYQKLFHQGVVKEPIPHLLIICDEFAELKQQEPEFMDELISVARIGRSLGVHLVLATQKPAGVVNDQIRSNMNFGICLKVQDRQDSVDVIQRPDAAFLKKSGQFYLQIGNEQSSTLGQSGWSGAPYIPREENKKKGDPTLKFVSETGRIIKEIGRKIVSADKGNHGEQLTNIYKYICDIAEKEKISDRQLWLDSLQENIFLSDLSKKYNIEPEYNVIKPVIGEYDDPTTQTQGPVFMDLSQYGNAIIYGNAQSGKENLISTIVYETMMTHSPEEAQMYLMDFGTEVLKIFKNSPNVGDVVFNGENEKIDRLFNMIQEEIKERIAILSNYNGDYQLYLKTQNRPMPLIMLMINNYDTFSETYEDKYEDKLSMITREGVKCGVVCIITVGNIHSLRYRITQNFKQKFVLQLNNQDDYLSILDKVGRKRPAHIFGRGLVPLNNDIYEFQIVKVCEALEWNDRIAQAITECKAKAKTEAKHIPTLPAKVKAENLINSFTSLKNIPIGIDRYSLSTFSWRLDRHYMTILAAKNLNFVPYFIAELIEELKRIQKYNIYPIDPDKLLENNKVDANMAYKVLKDNITNTSDDKINICIIIGLESFLTKVETDQEAFFKLLKDLEGTGRYFFFIAESSNKIKNHQYDNWYKEYNSGDTGIWIGKGFSNQYVFTYSGNGTAIEKAGGDVFASVVEDGETRVIKLLGMESEDEENE